MNGMYYGTGLCAVIHMQTLLCNSLPYVAAWWNMCFQVQYMFMSRQKVQTCQSHICIKDRSEGFLEDQTASAGLQNPAISSPTNTHKHTLSCLNPKERKQCATGVHDFMQDSRRMMEDYAVYQLGDLRRIPIWFITFLDFILALGFIISLLFTVLGLLIKYSLFSLV